MSRESCTRLMVNGVNSVTGRSPDVNVVEPMYLLDQRIFLLRLHGQALKVVLQRFQKSDGVLVVGDGRRRRHAAGRSPMSHDDLWRRRRRVHARSRFSSVPVRAGVLFYSPAPPPSTPLTPVGVRRKMTTKTVGRVRVVLGIA